MVPPKLKKATIVKQFPAQDIKGYAEKGVRQLAQTFVRIALSHDDRRPAEVVLPSRGAVSPTIHALLYILAAFEKNERYADATGRIYVPQFILGMMKNVLGKRSTVNKHFGGEDAPVRLVILPFTADVNIDVVHDHIKKHGEDIYRRVLGIKPSDVPDNDRIKVEIRKGGVRVLKEMLKDPEKRLPLYKVFTNILEAEGRTKTAEEYRRYKIPENSKLYIIDTVISGTAATHIKKAADEEGLKMTPILLIDKNGNKLHKEKRKLLRKWEVTTGGKMIFSPRLPAEDRGVGFLGVAAIVYPQIGLYLRNISEELYPTLFGTWIPIYMVSTRFQDVFRKYTRVVMSTFSKEKGVFNRAYEDFVNTLALHSNLLLKHGMATPEDLVSQLQGLGTRGTLLYAKDVDHVHETASRVAHVLYDPRRARDIIERRILKI